MALDAGRGGTDAFGLAVTDQGRDWGSRYVFLADSVWITLEESTVFVRYR